MLPLERLRASPCCRPVLAESDLEGPRFLIRWEGQARHPFVELWVLDQGLQGLRGNESKADCAAAPGSDQVQEKGM